MAMQVYEAIGDVAERSKALPCLREQAGNRLEDSNPFVSDHYPAFVRLKCVWIVLLVFAYLLAHVRE